MGNGRKRKRGDLARVAEIVMVLAAFGEVRGGRRPTAAERALAAEARGRLAAEVASAVEMRPKELYPREAVRALVEDLGLTRPSDPARPGRPSIAHRILLTKRKMEQSKESRVHPATHVPQTTKTSGATSVFQHGASNKSASPTRVAMLSSASKQSRPNGTPAGVSSAKTTSLTSSIVSLPPAGSANVEVEKGVNYPSSSQSGATIGQAKTSAHFNAIRSSQSTVQNSNGGKSEEKKAPSIQPDIGNTVIGHQVPPGATLVQQKPRFSNHNAIAKHVQQVLHQPANHPSWTLPSTEYMHAGLDCQICKTCTTDVDSLLVCDACERGVHLTCLQHYENEGLPNGEWYCTACVAYSKGKPMPSKYGKVARKIAAPKASLTSGVTLQRASVNQCIEKVAEDDQKSAEADSSACNTNSSSLALNTSSKAQLVSASEHQKENIKDTETSPADQTYQADVAADTGIGYPQDDETSEAKSMSEHSNAYLLTSSRDSCPKHEAPKNEAVGHNTDLSDGNWVGDALKVVDHKTYYNSCNIDGITYNLQDHILIAFKNSKYVPSKLQSLWEEHDSKSKLAMVNPYFFASDIPESVIKPCTAEENEVYASDNQRIIMVSSICGPCDVLHVDEFREETERRNQVVCSDGRLHRVFFVRWRYDESLGSFVGIDSSMGS
uniref:Uncharacterized protein n=1 Tax=Avena sativa TaxID=4498 RepID=A0ACD5ZRR0_AVESA